MAVPQIKPSANRQVVVVKRAQGIPTPDVFRIREESVPECPRGGVLVRVLYAAVDPAMRGWLSMERNYLTVPDGAVMRAEGVGEIIESQAPQWRAGDFVYGVFGWQQYAAVDVSQLHRRVDLGVAPAPVWLGSLGINGLTAWVGLRHLARVRAGETVLVSTAAGAVGSAVAGLARASDARVVGLTGGPDKVKRCVDSLHCAAAIDYKAEPDLARAIAQACPAGVDVFFDNTGGAIADAAFESLKRGARIVQCGTAAVSSWLPPPAGPRRERDMLVKRLSWHGFVILDHVNLFAPALEELVQLYAAGKLDAQTDVLEGLDAAPGAISRLYGGTNQGRLCIRI
jgi:NADPH-dependent curcumin reductase CurA